MLPAGEGDCLWIRYGSLRAPRQILIDAGRKDTASYFKTRLLSLPKDRRSFELFVITHVDRDHIEGAAELLRDPAIRASFKDIWFNGYSHLTQADVEAFGPIQGEVVTAALLNDIRRWNRAFRRRAIRVSTRSLPRVKLAGGLTLTVLSPDQTKLAALAPIWSAECRKAGISPARQLRHHPPRKLERFGKLDVDALAAEPFIPDVTPTNGASIALLVAYRGKKVLLAADAHADTLLGAIRRLGGGKPIRLDLLKVSHHGSEGNTSIEFLNAIDCATFAVSTNGSYFGHPSPTAIARIVKSGTRPKTVVFNYRTKFNRIWDDHWLKARYRYNTIYSDSKSDGCCTIAL